MSWLDFFSFLGGGAQAAGNTLQQAETFRLKDKEIDSDEKIAKLKQEVAEIIAGIKASSSENVAKTNAGAKVESATIGADASRDVAGTNAGARVESANIGADAQRDVATTTADSRRDVATTTAGAARDVAKTNAGARVQSATIGANASILNNNNRIGEAGREFDTTLPLKEFGADTDRINAQRPRVNTNPFLLPGANGGVPSQTTAPTFGPSYNDFIQKRGVGPRQPAPAPAPATQPPPGALMDTPPDAVPAANNKPAPPVTPAAQAPPGAEATAAQMLTEKIAAAMQRVATAKTPAERQAAQKTLSDLTTAAKLLLKPAQ